LTDEVEVLFADNHLLAVAKPACVPIVADESGDESLHERAKAWVARTKNKPGEAYLGVLHRLDRPVSGVVLFARTSKAAARLTDQFRARRVRKLYLAVVERAPEAPRGVLEQWLAKDRARNVVSVRAPQTQDAKRAVTRWSVREERPDGTALVELEPETGRSHQLRVAMSSMGAPLVGDVKYGASAPLDDRSIALHAARLEVEHPTLREPVVLECPPPRRAPWR
jgi:23S rRNA pseudouridine1911/1915/1917 synthase